jgi:hypothetical protein
MAKAKYRTVQHKALRRKWAAVIATGHGRCVEPICLMTSRWIEPGSAWDVPHNEDGVTYRDGPAHAKCNRAEGATRGNRKRSGRHSSRSLVL